MKRWNRGTVSGAMAAVLAVVVVACSSAGSPQAETKPTAASKPCTVAPSAGAPKAGSVTGSIRVLAAASLTGAFDELAHRFSEQNPEAKVDVSFGASSSLVEQIHQGAPADVLATADTTTMDTALAAGDVTRPVTFTCNRMTILVPTHNPAHITSLASLTRHDVRFVLCAAPVPCGRLGREVLQRAGVHAQPVGSEKDVKSVVAKVAQGEVDAGIVYVTDAEAAEGSTDSVPIPSSDNVETSYPIAVTTGADNPTAARAFGQFVRSPEGQRVLHANGFGT